MILLQNLNNQNCQNNQRVRFARATFWSYQVSNDISSCKNRIIFTLWEPLLTKTIYSRHSSIIKLFPIFSLNLVCSLCANSKTWSVLTLLITYFENIEYYGSLFFLKIELLLQNKVNVYFFFLSYYRKFHFIVNWIWDLNCSQNQEMVAEGELRNNVDDSDRVRELQDKVVDLKAEVRIDRLFSYLFTCNLSLLNWNVEVFVTFVHSCVSNTSHPLQSDEFFFIITLHIYVLSLLCW